MARQRPQAGQSRDCRTGRSSCQTARGGCALCSLLFCSLLFCCLLFPLLSPSLSFSLLLSPSLADGCDDQPFQQHHEPAFSLSDFPLIFPQTRWSRFSTTAAADSLNPGSAVAQVLSLAEYCGGRRATAALATPDGRDAASPEECAAARPAGGAGAWHGGPPPRNPKLAHQFMEESTGAEMLTWGSRGGAGRRAAGGGANSGGDKPRLAARLAVKLCEQERGGGDNGPVQRGWQDGYSEWRHGARAPSCFVEAWSSTRVEHSILALDRSQCTMHRPRPPWSDPFRCQQRLTPPRRRVSTCVQGTAARWCGQTPETLWRC